MSRYMLILPARKAETWGGLPANGTTISKYTARDGMDQPIVQWTPSISPSGLTIYSGDRFPEWRGNVFLSWRAERWR